MANVVLKEVSKVYEKDVTAVDNVSINIHDKEFVVLVGPSGCGKSTILRMIAGLEDITKGELYLGERIVNEIPPKDRDIAMVFQNYALYPHMTVQENMAFGLKLRKYGKYEIKTRVDDAADILGIKDLLNRKPKALSGGQRQRVAVGRAIVRNPEVFLFDEPLSNLDAKLRVQMRTEISKLHNKLQTTMIYVTHDQVEAMTMGDRIVVLKDGVVQQMGTPLDIYNAPNNKFVAGFIGSPAMNFMRGKVIKDKGLIFDEGSIKLRISPDSENRLTRYLDKEVILGIRPEDIHDSGAVDSVQEPSKANLTLEVVEPMGNETILYVSTGKHSIISRVNSNYENVQGKVDLVFDMAKTQFFDVETEEVISNHQA